MAELRAAYSNHSWEVPVLPSRMPHIPAALTKQSGRRRSAYLQYFVNATGDEHMVRSRTIEARNATIVCHAVLRVQ